MKFVVVQATQSAFGFYKKLGFCPVQPRARSLSPLTFSLRLYILLRNYNIIRITNAFVKPTQYVTALSISSVIIYSYYSGGIGCGVRFARRRIRMARIMAIARSCHVSRRWPHQSSTAPKAMTAGSKNLSLSAPLRLERSCHQTVYRNESSYKLKQIRAIRDAICCWWEGMHCTNTPGNWFDDSAIAIVRLPPNNFN